MLLLLTMITRRENVVRVSNEKKKDVGRSLIDPYCIPDTSLELELFIDEDRTDSFGVLGRVTSHRYVRVRKEKTGR